MWGVVGLGDSRGNGDDITVRRRVAWDWGVWVLGSSWEWRWYKLGEKRTSLGLESQGVVAVVGNWAGFENLTVGIAENLQWNCYAVEDRNIMRVVVGNWTWVWSGGGLVKLEWEAAIMEGKCVSLGL